MPTDIGTTTPAIATNSDARPTLLNSSRSVSIPTVASRTTTPISARTFMASVEPTSPSTDGPMRMPAVISPITAGMCTRSESSAAALATIRMTARSLRMTP